MNTFINGATKSFKKFTAMLLSNYTYRVEKFAGHDVLLIEGAGFRGRSLTNDIEKVVADISWNATVDPGKFIIVYKDSFGMWDGWDHKEQAFIITSCRAWEDSVNAIIKFKKL